MKKGDISPVFTYIFVAIIGAIIIGFFATFGFQQLSLGNKLNSAEIAKTLDDNLNAFSISKSSDKDIEFGLDTKLLFNNLVCGTLSTEEGINLRTSKIIFSQKSFQGNTMKAWTLAFKYPFHVTNFFYLSDDRIFYYIVYDGSNQQYVEEKFFSQNSQYKIPSRFNVKKIRSNDISNQLISSLLSKYNSVKLVYFTTPNINPKDRLKIIEIDNNKVKFHNENREEVLLGDEFILGAVFSEDYNNFKCGFDEAVRRLKIISSLYIEKKEKLIAPAKGLACDYGIITANLDYFINNDPTINNFDPYKNNKNNLIINNNDLEGADDCEALF
ncbi:hypothetical protein HYX17_00095 [Candidatus Woesearchaeota archaeon]|nr:hypothetical protein [Candidatus Woesearchaeota archaeon]